MIYKIVSLVISFAMTENKKKIHFQDLGLIDYKEACDFQEILFKFNVDFKIENLKDDKTVTETKNHLIF